MIHEILDHAQTSDSGHPAVTDAGDTWTYGQLWTVSLKVAAWLSRRGISPGERVAVCIDSHRYVLALAYGASIAEVVLVPLGEARPAAMISALTQDCDASLVIAPDDADLAAISTTRRSQVVPLSIAIREISATPRATSPRGADSEAPFLIMYTSGSTTLPKGVLGLHDQVQFASRAIAQRLAYRREDRVLCLLPLAFDYGLYQAWLCATAGAHLLLRSRASASVGIAKAVKQVEPTVIPVTPTLASSLEVAARRTRPPPSVRLFTNTGAHLSSERATLLRERFPGSAVVFMYGLTECKRVSISQPDVDLTRPGTVGLPLEGTSVRVVDKVLEDVPPGTLGQFIVAGPHVMAGYWRSPQLTHERFREDRRGRRSLLTGDFGTTDAEGHLYIHGRRDDLIKVRGVRTSVTELEHAIACIPGVREVCVVATQQRTSAHVFAAGPIDLAATMKALRKLIEPDKIPPSWTVLSSLPQTPNGKFDRKELLRLAEGEPAAG